MIYNDECFITDRIDNEIIEDENLNPYIDRQIQWRNQTFAFWTMRLGEFILNSARDKNFMNKVLNNGMSLLNDDYSVFNEQILVSSGSYIFEPLNNFILQSHQHGFSKYFQQTSFRRSIIPDDEDPNKVLTTYMLSAGFNLWLYSVTIACVVFVLEHLVRYLSKMRRRYVEQQLEQRMKKIFDFERRVHQVGMLYMSNNIENIKLKRKRIR